MTSARNRGSRWVAIAAMAMLIGACSTGTVVLLPEKDGRATAITVTQGDKAIVLDQPYAATRTTAFGPRAYKATPEEVEKLAGPALAAQPARPTQFTLYFVEGKDEFTDESKRSVDGVFAEIAKRPVPDIVVIGHADAVGNDQQNEVLSRQRAESVRAALIQRGIAPDNIVAVGRGKRDPLVATAAGVAEPRNRRVDILVR